MAAKNQLGQPPKKPEQQSNKKCLVISGNSDGRQLKGMLSSIGLIAVASDTGQKGVGAIERVQPKVIIFFYRAGNEEDAAVFGVIQSLRTQKQSSPAMVIVGVKEQTTVLKILLGIGPNDHAKVRVVVYPPADQPTQTLETALKSALDDLLKEQTIIGRQPAMAVQAASA